MRIELEAYTPAMRKFIKAREMACVYVLSHRGEKPCRIGHALDIHSHVALIQSTNAALIEVNHLLWTPGKMVAVVIENSVRHELNRHHLRQKWFDIEESEAINVVTATSSRLYPSARLITHETIIRQLSSTNERRAI